MSAHDDPPQPNRPHHTHRHSQPHSDDDGAWADRLDDYLKDNGLRLTRQRRLIAEAFFEAGGHCNAEELYERVRRDNPGVGQATVYRTLKLLEASGLVSSSRFGTATTHFESVDGGHHDHLICTRCGRIVEFVDDEIEVLQDAVAARFGFVLEDHKMELYGVPQVCVDAPDCRYVESATARD